MNSIKNINAIIDIFGNILSFEVIRENGSKETLPYRGNESLELNISEYVIPTVKKAKFLDKNKASLEVTFQDGRTVIIDETKLNEFTKESSKFIETGRLDNTAKKETLFTYLLTSACQKYNCSKEDMRKEPYISFFRNMLGNVEAKSKIDGFCDLVIRTCGLEKFVTRKSGTFHGPNDCVPSKDGIRKVVANTDILGNVIAYTAVMFNGEEKVKTIQETRKLGITQRAAEKRPPIIKNAKYADKEKTKLNLTYENGMNLIIDCNLQTYANAIRNYMTTKTFTPNKECIDVFSYVAHTFCRARNCSLSDIAGNQVFLAEFSNIINNLSKKAEKMPLDEIIIRECGLERFFKGDKRYVSRVSLGKHDALNVSQLDLKNKGLQGYIYTDTQKKYK